MQRFSVCLFVLSAPLLLFAQTPGESSPWTLPTYVAELERLSAFLGSASEADAEAASASIAPRWEIAAGTERVFVDARWLVTGMRGARDAGEAWRAQRESLRRRLLDMRAHAIEYRDSAAAVATQQGVRAAVQDVLQRPEFRQVTSIGWRERLQQLIGDWLQSLGERLGFGDITGRSFALGVAWLAAIAALGGLGIWLVRVLGNGRSVSIGLAHSEQRRTSAREWALRARAALRAGDLRQAIRCAYNGALRRMEEEGAWRMDRSRTPREYLRLLKPGDHRSPAVKDLTHLFEQVWYANRLMDDDAVQRVGANLEALGCLYPGERAM